MNPEQPHVDHVTDRGRAVLQPVRQERVEGALWWTKPTAVELTEEQAFIDGMEADLHATMATAGEGMVMYTFDWWMAHNHEALRRGDADGR